MGLFFKEGRGKNVAVDLTPEQIEEALVMISDGKPVWAISAKTTMPPRMVSDLTAKCRMVEPDVTARLAADEFADRPALTDYIRGVTQGWFPAVKFVGVMIADAGGTFANLVAAAKAE